MKMIPHIADAIEAEERGDWTSAKEYWYRAAEGAGSNGDLRSYYNQREDAADQKRREALNAPPTV